MTNNPDPASPPAPTRMFVPRAEQRLIELLGAGLFAPADRFGAPGAATIGWLDLPDVTEAPSAVELCSLDGHPLATMAIDVWEPGPEGGIRIAGRPLMDNPQPLTPVKDGVAIVADECLHRDQLQGLPDDTDVVVLRYYQCRHVPDPRQIGLGKAHALALAAAATAPNVRSIHSQDIPKRSNTDVYDRARNQQIAANLGCHALWGPDRVWPGDGNVSDDLLRVPDSGSLDWRGIDSARSLTESLLSDDSSVSGQTWPTVEAMLRSTAKASTQRGCTLLLTGLSGSGKSTIAEALTEALIQITGRPVSLLDGDVVRLHLSKGLGFSREDRETNILRIGFVAREITYHGGIAVCAPIAPFRSTRDQLRQWIGSVGEFIEVHVATPLAVCEARDPKGLYAQARAGQLPDFTGIDSPYEEPTEPALRLDTQSVSVDECVDRIIALMRQRQLIP